MARSDEVEEEWNWKEDLRPYTLVVLSQGPRTSLALC